MNVAIIKEKERYCEVKCAKIENEIITIEKQFQCIICQYCNFVIDRFWPVIEHRFLLNHNLFVISSSDNTSSICESVKHFDITNGILSTRDCTVFNRNYAMANRHSSSSIIGITYDGCGARDIKKLLDDFGLPASIVDYRRFLKEPVHLHYNGNINNSCAYDVFSFFRSGLKRADYDWGYIEKTKPFLSIQNVQNVCIPASLTTYVLRDKLWSAMLEASFEYGVTLDGFNIWNASSSEQYRRRIRTAQSAIVWGIDRMQPYDYSKNLLFLENGLLFQQSGIIADLSGFFEQSSIVKERKYEQKPSISEISSVLDHLEKYSCLKRDVKCDQNGPILIALQVHSDNSVHRDRFSGGWPDNDPIESMLSICSKYLPDIDVVVRPHPKDVAWFEVHYDKYSKYFKPKWKLQDSTTVDLYSFLPKCRAVVSINSTVLIESMYIHDMRIAALGRGIFSTSNTLLECDTDASLLQHILNHKHNYDTRIALLNAILKQQISYKCTKEQLLSFPIFKEWIGKIAGITKQESDLVSVQSSKDIGAFILCHDKYLHFLESCIQSVEKQTVKPKQKMIVLDGCDLSTDITIPKDWQVIQCDYHDPSKSRNIAFQELNTKFIIPIDGDNLLTEQYVEKIHDKVNDTNVAIYHTSLDLCDNTMRKMRTRIAEDLTYWDIRHSRPIDTSSAWHRKAVIDVGGWPVVEAHEDYVLPLLLTSRGWNMKAVPDARLLYRCHDDSRARSVNKDVIKQVCWKYNTMTVLCLMAGRINVLDKWYQWLQEEDFPPQTRLLILDNSRNIQFSNLLHQILFNENIIQKFSNGTTIINDNSMPEDMNRPSVVRHIAKLYNRAFNMIDTDKIMIVEDDVIGKSGYVHSLSNNLYAQNRLSDRIAAITAPYSDPNNPDVACMAISKDNWHKRLKMANIEQNGFVNDIGFVPYGFTLLWNSAIRSIEPIVIQEENETFNGHDCILSQKLRNNSWKLAIDCTIPCMHYIHGKE